MRGTSTRLHYVPPPVLRLVVVLLALIIIIANGAMAVIVLYQQRDSDSRVGRALQAMLALKEVADLTEGSGKSLRVYLLTGDTYWLDSYRTRVRELPEELLRLRDLIADDGTQISRLERLVTMIDFDRAALAASLTANEQSIDLHPSSQELVSGANRTNHIVTAVDEMLQSEAKLLEGHISLDSSHGKIALATVFLGTIGGIVLIGFIFLLMRRDVRQSEQLAEVQSGALLESELRFRRIFEQSPVGIVLIEQDGRRIVQANPAFCRMVGYDGDAISGMAIADMTHVDDRRLLTDAIARGTDADGVEIRHVTRSGVIAWARVHLAALSTSDERPGYLLALVEDVTREKRVEAELRQAQKMEAIGQLTGGIAHDFNNLLGVIIGNVEFLIDAAQGNQEQVYLAKEILDSALSGADLTRRLLAFARRQALQPRITDLNAYLPNHITILRRLLGETIQINATLAGNLWPTRADPSQVGDALLNLTINARDAMPHGGRIWIETANAHLQAEGQAVEVTPGDYVVLSVSDTGTGMTAEVLERVVEPFFTTKSPGAGSGLGLSMIFGFAKQSGGHLKVESELGHGTTIRLYLPRAELTEADHAEEALEESLATGSESILLVDDNPEMRAVARRHLASLGYQVCEAGSGPAALAILQDGSFDLLFTDIVMPDGMTGYQLAAAAQALRPDLKVLYTTGYAGSLAEWAEPQRGTMLRKPYRKQVLAATIRAALEA